MTKSSKCKFRGKPAKPHRDFPLFAHGNGSWAKKIKGRVYYFGPWRDPQAALEKFLRDKDEILAGRTPNRGGGGLTVASLANHFLTHKRQLQDSGELSPRTFARYHASCALVVSVFGKSRPIESLCPEDFQGLRGRMTTRWSPVTVGNEIQMVRSLFRFADEAGLLEKRVRFGPGFRKPSAKTLRQARSANGPRMFTQEQIRAALEYAGPNMKSMILLGVNAALGNTDLGLMPIKAVDLEGGWLNYPRAKTAIPRRIPLWPETVDAIRWVLAVRPEPKDPEDDALLFIGPRGKSFEGSHRGYRVTAEWNKLAKKAGVQGRTFYDFRRTFLTIAEGSRDLAAVQSIMGHAPGSGDAGQRSDQAQQDSSRHRRRRSGHLTGSRQFSRPSVPRFKPFDGQFRKTGGIYPVDRNCYQRAGRQWSSAGHRGLFRQPPGPGHQSGEQFGAHHCQ